MAYGMSLLELEAEMDFLAQVRTYFLHQNGMTWSAGLDLPDGFEESLTVEDVASS